MKTPPPVRAMRGEFVGHPLDPERYEIVQGVPAYGHVILLDHALMYAWPFMTREGAIRSLTVKLPAQRRGRNWQRAAHTYTRYTGKGRS